MNTHMEVERQTGLGVTTAYKWAFRVLEGAGDSRGTGGSPGVTTAGPLVALSPWIPSVARGAKGDAGANPLEWAGPFCSVVPKIHVNRDSSSRSCLKISAITKQQVVSQRSVRIGHLQTDDENGIIIASSCFLGTQLSVLPDEESSGDWLHNHVNGLHTTEQNASNG